MIRTYDDEFSFLFLNLKKTLIIQLQEKSPAFDIFSGSKQTRLVWECRSCLRSPLRVYNGSHESQRPRENGASQSGDLALIFSRGQKRKFLSSSFFASKPHENVCYAGYISNWIDEFERGLKSMNPQIPHWLCYSLCCKLQNYSYCMR